MGGDWVRRGTRVLCGITLLATIATFGIFLAVRHFPAPGDISQALSHHPGAYKLSLGHMLDLTFDSFAYLRLPLLIASVAFLAGAVGTFRWLGQRAFLAAALMMIVFFHAARLALVVFDPFLSSRPLAEAILRSPDGKLINNRHYYSFSSVTFYTNRDALILNGRYFNLEYGSYAPRAPAVFIDNEQFKQLWLEPRRYYLLAYADRFGDFEQLVGAERLITVTSSGGKVVLTNHPLTNFSPVHGSP
jgi:hypothetical protein